MQKEVFVFCNIKIKQELVPYNYGGTNYQLRAEKQKEVLEKFRSDYFRVLNSVVENGGVFCVDKYILESEYRMFVPNVRIRIPAKAFDTIKALPLVEEIAYS